MPTGPRVPGDPTCSRQLLAPLGWVGAQALGNWAVDWASAQRLGAQVLFQASGERARSQAEGQEARSWAWPGRRVHSASSWAKMRKRGLNGTWDGCGEVDRKSSLWHTELNLVEEGEAPEWIRVGPNHI